MVAYSFAPRFAALVESGAKTQTIRGHRKRHARPGEPVQLYTGMRTKGCRKLVAVDPVCTMVEPVRFDACNAALSVEGIAFVPTARDLFARQDGFDGIEDMAAWWRGTHGEAVFEGVLIRWAA